MTCGDPVGKIRFEEEAERGPMGAYPLKSQPRSDIVLVTISM
jgi:hypothetical protein